MNLNNDARALFRQVGIKQVYFFIWTDERQPPLVLPIPKKSTSKYLKTLVWSDEQW